MYEKCPEGVEAIKIARNDQMKMRGNGRSSLCPGSVVIAGNFAQTCWGNVVQKDFSHHRRPHLFERVMFAKCNSPFWSLSGVVWSIGI